MPGPLHGEHGRLRVQIDLVPMIDILLVLLVIFMLAQIPRRVIPLQLPPVARADPPPQPVVTQIVLQLREDGGYAINGTMVARDVLLARLREIYLERPVKLLFIQTAPRRRYQEVIEAADLARDAGVQVIGYLPYQAPRTR